jgi:hypothetical protein
MYIAAALALLVTRFWKGTDCKNGDGFVVNGRTQAENSAASTNPSPDTGAIPVIDTRDEITEKNNASAYS